MKPDTPLFRRTCKQATALLIAREDQALKLSDHITLKLHLVACKACSNFENQVLSIRAAMRRWRSDGGNAKDTASADKDKHPAI